MIRIEKKHKRNILVISLFILLLQLIVNHLYGGITMKSLIIISVGWFISIAMLTVVFSSIYKK